jgi:hypothetical protein
VMNSSRERIATSCGIGRTPRSRTDRRRRPAGRDGTVLHQRLIRDFHVSKPQFSWVGHPATRGGLGGMVRAGYDYLTINPLGFYVIGRSFR